MSRRKPSVLPTSPVEGPKVWRSLDEKRLSAAERADEAATEQAVLLDPADLTKGSSAAAATLSRRNFLFTGGATGAAVSLGACIRRPEAYFAPYAQAPEQLTPGTPLRFATVLDRNGDVFPVEVETHGARPTKVEGNAAHPWSLGATNLYAQGAVLDLYDPDRLQAVRSSKGGAGEKDAGDKGAGAADKARELLKTWGNEARRTQGRGLGIMLPPVTSPTVVSLIKRLKSSLPQALVVRFAALHDESVLEGTKVAFGTRRRPVYSLDEARVLVSFGADLVGDEWAGVRSTKGIAQSRRLGSAKDTPPRIYVVESDFSLTGAYADHRLARTDTSALSLLLGLAGALERHLDVDLGLPKVPQLPALDDEAKAWVPLLAEDLAAHKGRTLVATGRRLPAWAHALSARINEALGNIGKVVSYLEATGIEALEEVATTATVGKSDIEAVQRWVFLDVDPLASSAAGPSLAQALDASGVEALALSFHVTATSEKCDWAVPLSHDFEAWGDALLPDGAYAVRQPLIEPLWPSLSLVEGLAALAGETEHPRNIVWAETQRLLQAPLGGDALWKKLLARGIVHIPMVKPAAAVDAAAVTQSVAAGLTKIAGREANGSLDAVFVADPRMISAQSANNPWLLELPHPMTKVSWCNPVSVGVADAQRLGLTDGDIVKVTRGAVSVEAAVAVCPGVAAGTVALAMGWGLAPQGRYGAGKGFNFTPLRESDLSWCARVVLEPTGRRKKLARTQTQNTMEGRPIAIDATLDEYRKTPNFPAWRAVEFSTGPLWKEIEYKGHRWGMVIDLNACTGCNTCTVACQAENNIPVVGEKEIARGRDMSWIRIDRYFVGDDENQPGVAVQPVGCQHCEIAPCENVCPVNATVHSPEGTNDMAYNRCIGTRYCMNNCPYKVRRFNYLDWHGRDAGNDGVPETKKMQFNPDVTVRMRGVMEKCSYCIQRVEAGKKRAKLDKRPLADGDITPACAQACPAEAIVFGDLNDPKSRVARQASVDRRYKLLAELGTNPRTSYLGRIRHVNPALVKSKSQEAAHTSRGLITPQALKRKQEGRA